MNKRFLLSIQRTIVFVKGRTPAPGKETHLFNCLRPIYDFLFKPTPIGEGLLSNIRPLGKNCAAIIEDPVSARFRGAPRPLEKEEVVVGNAIEITIDAEAILEEP
jgi:hypothetical protein